MYQPTDMAVNATKTTDASNMHISATCVEANGEYGLQNLQFIEEPVTGITVGMQKSGMASKDQAENIQSAQGASDRAWQARSGSLTQKNHHACQNPSGKGVTHQVRHNCRTHQETQGGSLLR